MNLGFINDDKSEVYRCNMHEIENDFFYDFVKQYDPDSEYYFVGEVEYHLLTDNKPYEGLRSHRDALIAVFDHLHPLIYV